MHIQCHRPGITDLGNKDHVYGYLCSRELWERLYLLCSGKKRFSGYKLRYKRCSNLSSDTTRFDKDYQFCQREGNRHR